MGGIELSGELSGRVSGGIVDRVFRVALGQRNEGFG